MSPTARTYFRKKRGSSAFLRLIGGLLITLGILLLTVQIIGLNRTAVGFPNASESVIPGYSAPLSSGQELTRAIEQGITATPSGYAQAVTELVYEGLAHGAPTQLRCEHSWVLCVLSYLWSPTLSYTQDPLRIVESSSAICSQSARVVTEIARRNNLPARLIGLEGHVIAEVFVNGGWQVVDPDYGVSLPLSYSAASESNAWHPEVIEVLKSRGHDESTIAAYLQFYDPNPDAVFHPIYAPDEPKPWLIETTSVRASWFIPLALVIIGGLILGLKRP